jgi:hypothetical protein
MSLKYHRKALDLVQHQPNFGNNFNPLFPESVSEWFSLIDSTDLLRKYSNQDEAVSPTEFKLISYQNTELIVFLYENQGVCWWAFENCHKNDPPVYVNTDPPLNNWRVCCNTFSVFVYTRLFDFLHWHDEDLCTLGIGEPVNDQTLEYLRKSFFEEPTTHSWPGHTQYRFSRNDQKILIQNDLTESNWYCSANSHQLMLDVFDENKHLFHWHHPTRTSG